MASTTKSPVNREPEVITGMEGNTPGMRLAPPMVLAVTTFAP